jgi:hypothetical protein
VGVHWGKAFRCRDWMARGITKRGVGIGKTKDGIKCHKENER